MFLFTTSILLFYDLSILFTNAEKPSSIRANTTSTRKFNRDYDKCVCFPGGQSLIPEIMDHKSNRMERLVVYLYRTVDTNEIIIFKPNPEKQELIPNIPFTTGDTLQKVSTEAIAALFDNNPHKVQSQDHSHIREDPIGLNIGTIENISPKPTLPDLLPILSKQNDASDQALVFPKSHPSQQAHLYPQNYEDQVLYYSYPGNVQQKYNPYHQNLPGNDPKYTHLPDNQYISTVITNHPNTWEPKDNKYYVPSNQYKSSPNVDVQQPGLIDELFKPNEYISKERWPKTILTFDTWFQKQLETFQDPKLPQALKAHIDFEILRSLVEKTLLENHIHIGATGVITDEKGLPINLKNLELRPILIGNPVKFQENIRFTLPQTLPYLEGILITLRYPPKVLGLIPLGKIYVSRPLNTKSVGHLHKVSNRFSIKHYETPLGLRNPWNYKKKYPSFDATDSFTTKGNVSLDDDSPNNYWKFAIGSGEEHRSQDGSNSRERDKILTLPNTSKSLKSVKTFETSKLFETSGLLKPQLILGKSKAMKLTKALKAVDGQISPKSSLESSPVSQSDYIHRNLLFENAYLPNPYDSEYKQLISTPIEDNSPQADSSTLQKTVTPFAVDFTPQLKIIPLDGKSKIYFKTESNTPKLIARPTNSDWRPSFPHKPDSISPNLTVRAVDSKPQSNFNSDKSNLNIVVTPINYDFKSSGSEVSVIPSKREEDSNSNGNSVSNSEWVYNPNRNNPTSTSGLSSTPTAYHNTKELKSQVRNSHLRKAETQHKVSSYYEKQTWTSGRRDDAKKPTTQLKNVLSSTNPQNDRVEGISRRFSSPLIKGVLKTLVQMVLNNFIAEVSDDTPGRRSGDDVNVNDKNIGTNSINPTGKTGVIEDGDRPDFRIIGGSAATGSGAPLSYKGRSGLSII